jgi:putative two-component system hydrogenase maturation factor HypX/HoxX
MFGAQPDGHHSMTAAPGDITGVRDGAVRIQCGTGSVWIAQLKRKASGSFKLPATMVLGADALAHLPAHANPLSPPSVFVPHGRRPEGFQEVWATVDGGVAYVHFEFYNGAMSTAQCKRLTAALSQVRARDDVKVVVLMGGEAFFSNGVHLNTIEAAADPAAESWANINAINDVVQAVFSMTDKVTVSAVRGNAGAGGVMAALAADFVWTHKNAVLNPHYKSMGLFGSEYWTHFLPARVGHGMASYLTETLQVCVCTVTAAMQ